RSTSSRLVSRVCSTATTASSIEGSKPASSPRRWSRTPGPSRKSPGPKSSSPVEATATSIISSLVGYLLISTPWPRSVGAGPAVRVQLVEQAAEALPPPHPAGPGDRAALRRVAHRTARRAGDPLHLHRGVHAQQLGDVGGPLLDAH